MFEDYRGIGRDAKYLVYSGIFPSLAYGMFYMDLPYFLTKVQGIPPVFMGTLISIMGVSTFFASISLGVIADRYGRKKMFIVGNVVASAIIAVFALTTNLFVLALAAIGEGVSEGAFSASVGALLAEKAGNERRTSVFSLYSFAQNIAFGVGGFMIPAVSVFESLGFSNREGHVLLYVLFASLSLVSTVLVLRISESGKLKAGSVTLRNLLPMKSKNVLIKYVITGAIIAFGAGMIVPLMSLWFSAQYGVPDSTSVPVLGISNLIIGFATLAAPPLAKKIGLVRAIVLTQSISTIFMFGTPLSPEFVSASVVYTLRAFLMNMANPLQQSMIMGLVTEDERGAASGVSAALWRLPNALSSIVGAWLIGLNLLATPFFLAGFFYIVSISLFWVLFRTTRMPEESRDDRASMIR